MLNKTPAKQFNEFINALNAYVEAGNSIKEKSIIYFHKDDQYQGFATLIQIEDLVKNPFQHSIYDDVNKKMPDMLKLAEKHISASVTTFATVEVEKILRSDLSIYGGADLGLDVYLSARSVEATLKDPGNHIKYLLERGTKVLPRVKGYFGVDYNNFEFEVGAGYPQLITVGVGYRFKF